MYIKFTRKEIMALAGSIILLGFVFGFDDGREAFVLVYWLSNFIVVCGLVTITILTREAIFKLVAGWYGASCEYSIWCMERFWFNKGAKYGSLRFLGKTFIKRVPIGSLLALFFSFLSNGKIFFTAIGNHTIEKIRNLRVGRKYVNLTGYEEALIGLAGPVGNLILILVANFIWKVFAIDTNLFIRINFWIIIFNMIPFSSLDGAKIFYGSKNLYVFGLVFILLAFILKNVGIIFSLVLSVILAFLILIVYYWKWERN